MPPSERGYEPLRPAEELGEPRKPLFVTVLRNTADPVRCFRLPDDRAAVMGAHIEL